MISVLKTLQLKVMTKNILGTQNFEICKFKVCQNKEEGLQGLSILKDYTYKMNNNYFSFMGIQVLWFLFENYLNLIKLILN